MPALDDFPLVPPGIRPAAQVEFVPEKSRIKGHTGTATNWRTIGEFYNELAKSCYLSGKESSANPGTPALDERCRNCFDSVVNNSRYVAIEIGVGGWQPHPAEKTQKRGYGDCKDLSTLLISYLRRDAVTAYPCLVRTRSMGPLDPDFPSFNFNHVITMAVDGRDTMWLDPTCEVCPYNELPSMEEGVLALAVTPEGGQLVRTPPSRPEDNVTRRAVEIHIKENQKAYVAATITVVGDNAQGLRHFLATATRDEVRINLERSLDGGAKRYKLLNWTVDNLNDRYRPLKITLMAERRSKCRRIGKTLYVRPYFFKPSLPFDRVDTDERPYPIDLFFPGTIQSTVTITWDTTLAVDSVGLPVPDSITTAFGAFHVSASSGPGKITYTYEKRYTAYQVDTTEFADYAVWQKRLKQAADNRAKLFLGTP
ncbi:MAG: hypothetical protein D6800_04040 [Candidatus Zixiibacteriota bacterium]|nr:MAG: hypothetical protein D6800_04040 [candidate division Zixibacteria bacterium]